MRDFLARLRGVKGPNGSGEYIAKCPAHDDGTASLCIRMGDKGIVCKCQAGCRTEDILGALGLKMKDLFADQRGQSHEKPQKKFVCAYRYTDESGKLLYESCRYIQENGKKTFLLRQPDPEHPGKYLYTKKGVRLVLYNLPSVVQAAKAGQLVIVCEGEKDADTLKGMGYTATTNAMGAGKWHAGNYTPSLAGADVVVLPDNDQPGNDHANQVAQALVGSAKRVRVARLWEVLPELPQKADISDVAEAHGMDRATEILEQAIAKAVTWEAPKEEEVPQELAELMRLYQAVPGYCVDSSWRICQQGEHGPKPLANFCAKPVRVIERDDGVQTVKEMQIDGWDIYGRKLPAAEIKASQFGGMSWVQECWDFSANILPGTAARDKVRYAISEVGRQTAKRVTEYIHTGWRKIGGRWAYLYHGGAIGAENVTVSLEGSLADYSLATDGETPAADCASFSLDVFRHMAPKVGIPLMSMIYLAPLREFLNQTGAAPAFSLFLSGKTMVGKSTAVALALSHYGDFNAHRLPASFSDTENRIRRSAFLLKDMPLVVDDYYPPMSMQERRRMEAIAQGLSRTFGNNSGRGRLRADLTIQQSMPPRALAIITGEDLPHIGESGTARFYTVDVKEGDVNKDMDMTLAAEQARLGFLRGAMRGYIEWLLPQADDLGWKLHEKFVANREKAQVRLGGRPERSSEAVAHLMIGYEMMTWYFEAVGLIGEDLGKQMLDHAWEVLTTISQAQQREAREDRPVRRFLGIIAELMVTHAAYTKNIIPDGKGDGGHEMIGYHDGEYYYLMPKVAYRLVSRFCQEQGEIFPLSLKAICKALKEEKILTPGTMDKGTATKNKWIDGRAQRLLWIPRAHIDDPDGADPAGKTEQLAMDGGQDEVDEVFPD